MTTAAIFYDAAMEYYDLGKIAKAKEKHELYEKYLEKAYALSKEAALKAQVHPNDDYWKYVYTRNAAYLAIERDQLEVAESLITIGLSGTPPIAEKVQLESALNQITDRLRNQKTSRDHLSIAGILVSLDIETNTVKIRQISTGENHTFQVAKSLLSEIASMYFGRMVKVSATETNILQAIHLAA